MQCDEGGGHPGHVHPDLEAGDGAARGGDGLQPHPGQREAGCGGPLRQGEPEEDPPIQGKWWVVCCLCFVRTCYKVSFQIRGKMFLRSWLRAAVIIRLSGAFLKL